MSIKFVKPEAKPTQRAAEHERTAMDREGLEEQFKAQCEQFGLDFDVLSSGPVNAELAIVGEGPGETECRQGKPFVGGSGNFMFDALRKYGIHRANTYVTNVVKRQISLARTGNEKHAVMRDELEKWIGLVRWELSQLPNVRIIFCVGNYALEAITGQSGITNWRGSVVDYKLPNGKLGKLVFANNPAYAMRELKQEPVFLMDCKKLDLVYRNVFKPYKLEELINPTYKETMAFLNDLMKSDKPVSLDVEHVSGETVCYGLANDGHKAMCINFRDAKTNRFTVSEEADIMLAIQKLCDSHRIIAQSGGHEGYWCWLHDWVVIQPWFDTLLAHHALYPQLPHSLQFLTAQYTTHPFYKDEGEEWKETQDWDRFWKYNCKDAAVTYYCHERLLAELKAQKQDKFFFEHVMRAQPHLIGATVHGVGVDKEIKQTIIEQCNEDIAILKADFYRIVHELTGDDTYYPNPNSPQQMKELFFEVLRLKGKGTSTDKTNRQHIMKNPETSALEKEMLAALDKYLIEDKFTGTFAEVEVSTNKVPFDGRFRCDYKQAGVQNAPGRLSSAKLIDGTGMNMQNQPHRARSMYVADCKAIGGDEDCVFVYFDLMQAEAQVVGYRANIAKWKEQFAQALKERNEGKSEIFDCHRALASEMFKKPYSEVPKEDFLDPEGRSSKDPNCNHAAIKPTIRYVSKRCRHGLNYRMERYRLAEVTQLPYYEAARAFALYHQITPELQRWWDQEEREFKKLKEIYNAYGRRFKIIQRLDEEAMKSLIAFYPQSTVGDKITQTWYMAEEDDEWPSVEQARVCIDVHDNLVGVCTPKVAKTCLKILKRHAESPIFISDAWHNKPEPLTIGADLKMSYPTVYDPTTKKFVEDHKGFHRWSHMKDVRM
jgi:uracil-DNA glycosylase